MARLFGTDGSGCRRLRAHAELARGLGRAAVAVLAERAEHRPVFLVGRDPRDSGVWLEEALVGGIHDAGGDVLRVGVEPTPAIAFLTIDAGADAGVVISASHNPPEYNGIKFFGPDGMKLPDGVEDGSRRRSPIPPPERRGGGSIAELEGGRERYLAHLLGAAGARLNGMTLVVDCANGAASEVAPALPATRRERPRDARHPTVRTSTSTAGRCIPRWRAPPSWRSAPTPGCRTTATPDRALFVDREGTHDRRRSGPRRVRDRDEGVGVAAERRGRHDGDGEPRVPSRDDGRRASRCPRPRWATATSSRRCSRKGSRSAESSPAT